MIHVAVLLKPYLDLILQGKKTVECRLTKDARDPYERIEPGERITWFRRHGVKAGNHVLFTPIDANTYAVGLARSGERSGRRT